MEEGKEAEVARERKEGALEKSSREKRSREEQMKKERKSEGRKKNRQAKSDKTDSRLFSLSEGMQRIEPWDM